MRKFGTTSVHLRSGNLVGFPCKRHQTKHLVFFPTCFASRGSPVRSRSRPPINSTIYAKRSSTSGVKGLRVLIGVGSFSQTGDRLRFALKPLFSSWILRELFGQNLDGDAAFQARIPSAVHLSHAASTKWRRDFIGAQVSAWSKGHKWRDYSPRIRLWHFCAQSVQVDWRQGKLPVSVRN